MLERKKNTKVYHHQADRQMLVLAKSVYFAERNVLLAVLLLLGFKHIEVLLLMKTENMFQY